MINAKPIIRTLRITYKTVMGALIMLHLAPAFMPAGHAAGYAPLQTLRLIEADSIRLSDVFADIDPARDQKIGPAPAPGHDVVLTARTLMKLAVAYNVKWRPETAADQVTLRREGSVIDTASIDETVKTALIKNGAPDRFVVAYNTPPQPILLPKGADTGLDPTQISFNPATGTFSMNISPRARAGQTLTLAGKIEPIVSVPVASTTLAKGSVVTVSDFEVVDMKASLVKNDMRLNIDDMVGMTVRRNIMAGQPVKTSDVEIPVIVERGEKILLTYRSGPLELSAQGRALQEGRRGDRIRVVNVDSNKNLQGTVLADSRVIID